MEIVDRYILWILPVSSTSHQQQHQQELDSPRKQQDTPGLPLYDWAKTEEPTQQDIHGNGNGMARWHISHSILFYTYNKFVVSTKCYNLR